MTEPKFKVSYDCEAEYEYEGKLYRIRTGCHIRNSSKDYLPQVIALIGTVTHRDHNLVHEFPSREVVEVFNKQTIGGKLVGAKWSEDFSKLIYDGERGNLVQVWDGSTIFYEPFNTAWKKWWDERNAA